MATNEPPPNYGFTNQPPPGAPMGMPGAGPMPGGQQQGNGMAVAGLVLGILGLVFCWVAVIGWILALLGVIFGGVGMSKANKIGGKGKGMAVAGLACGAIGLILGIALFFWALNQVKKDMDRWDRRHGELIEQTDTRVAGYVLQAPDA